MSDFSLDDFIVLLLDAQEKGAVLLRAGINKTADVSGNYRLLVDAEIALRDDKIVIR